MFFMIIKTKNLSILIAIKLIQQFYFLINNLHKNCSISVCIINHRIGENKILLSYSADLKTYFIILVLAVSSTKSKSFKYSVVSDRCQ